MFYSNVGRLIFTYEKHYEKIFDFINPHVGSLPDP